MDDHLERLIDDPGGSPLGRALIASAAADIPSPDGRARAAKRLGIAAVIAAGAGAGSEAGALAAAWKLAAVALALGGVVGLAIWRSPASEPERAAPVGLAVHVTPPAHGGEGIAQPPPPTLPTPASPPPPSPSPDTLVSVPAARLSAPPSPPPRGSRPRPSSPEAPRSPAGVVPAPPAAGPEALAPAPVTPEALAPAPVAPEPAAAAPEPPAPEGTTPPGSEIGEVAAGPSRLAAEVALVDRARASLRAGDHRAAVTALAEYHQRFASGDLDAEADVVAIEILIAEHDLPRARTLGTAFFARFPRSPLAQRVHSLLDHLPN